MEYQDFRKKMYSHLAQRGFSYDAVAPVINRIWDEGRSANPSEKECP
jgi:hypothetical protein